MSDTTVKRIDFNLIGGGKNESFQCPDEMKTAVLEMMAKRKIKSFSAYVKLAVNNQLQQDLLEIA